MTSICNLLIDFLQVLYVLVEKEEETRQVAENRDAESPAMAQALFEKANQPKRIYVQAGGSHNHLIDVGGKALEDQIGAFLQSLR
jgi:hypothetical protein